MRPGSYEKLEIMAQANKIKVGDVLKIIIDAVYPDWLEEMKKRGFQVPR